MPTPSSFISIDIETSGLPAEEGSEVLEICMIYGDYGRSGSALNKKIHFFIEKDHDSIKWSPDAREVLVDYEQRYLSGSISIYSMHEAREILNKFFMECFALNGEVKPMLTGKGLYSLILPMLKREDLVFPDLVDHNGLDFISSFYFYANGRASLNKICKIFNVPLIGKCVYSDCVKVVSCFYEAYAKANNLNSVSWY